MVKIDKIEDGLPISVVIPLSESRRKFFEDYVLPMIEINNPNEIITVSNEGSACKQRNIGWKKSTQPYVFFCDDDIMLSANHLEKLYTELIKSNCEFAYSGYLGIVLNPDVEPNHNFVIESQEFDYNTLKMYNYISTMSLVCSKCFCGFDENLKRFQDWDVWLTMASKGMKGKFVKDLKFLAYYLDKGLTSKENSQVDAYNIIRKKHNI